MAGLTKNQLKCLNMAMTQRDLDADIKTAVQVLCKPGLELKRPEVVDLMDALCKADLVEDAEEPIFMGSIKS